ncbi:MAG: M15 family metallopeptidase [Rhodanobacteraceae bacterium]
MPPASTHAVPPRRCRDTGERHALLARALALGIPRDYGPTRHLRVQREPAQLIAIGPDIHGRMQWLQPRAARALARMLDAAAHNGIELQVVSAFRSIEYQFGIVERKLARGLSLEDILRVSAAPGYSEHHTGRCVDFTTPGFAALEETFEHSPAFAWLRRHAADHGFAMSYPRGNHHGIAYEPWHWCWHARTR